MSLDFDEIREMERDDRFQRAFMTSLYHPEISAFADGIIKKSSIVYKLMLKKLDGLARVSAFKPLFSSSTCLSQEKLSIASDLITICCSPLGVVSEDDCLLALSRKLSKSDYPSKKLFYSAEFERIEHLSVGDHFGRWTVEFCLYSYDYKKDDKYRVMADAIDEAVLEAKKIL